MKRIVICLATYLGACGGDAGSAEDPPGALIGYWTLADPNAPCTHGLTFARDGDEVVYEEDVVCRLESDGYGMESELGTASQDEPGFVTLHPKQATCSSSKLGTRTLDLSIVNGSLAKRLPTGVAYYQPVSSDQAPSGIVQYGCFDSASKFTVHALGDI